MRFNNPVNRILLDLDKDQYWLAAQIKRSRTHMNAVINGKYDSWVVRRKIANALGKPENELFPEDTA